MLKHQNLKLREVLWHLWFLKAYQYLGKKNSLGCCHAAFQLGWQDEKKSPHVKSIIKLIVEPQYKKGELKNYKNRADIRAEQAGLDPAWFQVQIDPSGTLGINIFSPQPLWRINEGTCNNACKLLSSGDGVYAACLNDGCSDFPGVPLLPVCSQDGRKRLLI